MSGSRRRRRQLLAGVIAFGSTAFLGCLGLGDDGDVAGDEDGTDDASADADGDGRTLRTESPLELVEPDATVDGGFAASNVLVTKIHGHGDSSHWHFAPLAVPAGEDRTLRIRYLDENIEDLPLGPDEEYDAEVELLDPSPEDFLEVSVAGDLVTFSGDSVGDGDLRFDLLRNGDPVWVSPLLEVEAVDSAVETVDPAVGAVDPAVGTVDSELSR